MNTLIDLLLIANTREALNEFKPQPARRVLQLRHEQTFRRKQNHKEEMSRDNQQAVNGLMTSCISGLCLALGADYRVWVCVCEESVAEKWE